MNIFVVVQQMLVLLAMMMIGFIAFKLKWLDDNACSKISKIVINVCNPCLIVNGVLGKEAQLKGAMLIQTLLLIVIYFAVLTLLSGPVAFLLRVKKRHYNLYRLMMIFSNVGFMGIPVISSIYGKESVLLVAFYILIYNLLLYTYGIYLAGNNRGEEGDRKVKKSGQWKRLANPGVAGCLLAIIIFASGVTLPDSVCTFFDYVGNVAVPFSMILIGASVAQDGKKEFFLDGKVYVFLLIKMLILPIAAAFLMRLVPWPAMVEGVFVLMFAMPVGAIVIMLASEGDGDAIECTKGIILTTLLSVVTIPIVSMFLTF